MILRRGWNIHTRTQLISVGPALLLTLLLTGFFTFARLQDLRQELNHYGQLIASGSPEAIRNDQRVKDIYLGDGDAHA